MTLWKEKILKRWVNEFESDPENFLKKKGSNVQAIMTSYWSELMSSDLFRDKYFPHLENETVGNPLKFKNDKRLSVLTVQHLYHMFIMEEKSNFDITTTDVIVEIGAGYGNLCRLINKYGFTGTYIIVDFPEQFKAQRYFLSNSGVDMSRVNFIPLKLDKIEDLIKTAKLSALIGTFSINEMPLDDRKHIEKYYELFDYVYIEHNRDFDGIDNLEYFEGIKHSCLKSFEILNFKDKHYQGNGAWFLIGKKNEKCNHATL